MPALDLETVGLEDNEEEYSPRQYEITAAPNDFNVATLYDFIKSGVVKIPGFQRHYVWDLGRASSSSSHC